MAKEKQLTQKQIDKLHRQYERKAAFTLKQTFDDFEKVIRNIHIVVVDTVYLILLLVKQERFPWLVFMLVVCTLIAVIAAKLFRKSTEKKFYNSKGMQIERSEGYTQNLLDALYAMPENPQYTVASTTALIYTYLGNTEMALMEGRS